MTELEKMQRAKMYVTKLSEGINPLTGEMIDNDTILKDVRFARCFYYISNILGKVIENGGNIGKKTRNCDLPFSFSDDILNKIEIKEKPITVSEFTKNINKTLEENYIRKITYKMITHYLVENDYLEEIILSDGKTTKGLTEKSKEIGITSEHRETQFKTYDVILYEETAQRFIIKNLETIIINYENSKENEKHNKKRKKTVWTINEEKQLILECNINLTVEEIAQRHNREIDDIKNKLMELGK